MNAAWAIRTAAILFWSGGVGFGLPCLPVMGFRAYGGGPFERAGVRAMVRLLLAFQIFCVLECAAGWLLWGGHRTGGVLALALLPIGAIFWWGFALPFAPPFAIARTVLVIVYWSALA